MFILSVLQVIGRVVQRLLKWFCPLVMLILLLFDGDMLLSDEPWKWNDHFLQLYIPHNKFINCIS